MVSESMWIFCSGLKRSGSTLQYQITTRLVEESGRGVGLGFCEPREWPGLLREHRNSGEFRVVKCHRYLPGAHRLLRTGRARSIFIHRDLRDVVVSWMNKTGRSFEQVMGERFLEELLEDHFHWSALPNTMTSVYEHVLEDLSGEVGRIADWLGIALSREEVERLAEAHSLQRQKRHIEGFDFEREGVKEWKETVYDPTTLLHQNHVHSGAPRQWEEELTPEQVARIEEVTGDWLPRHGYPIASTGPSQRQQPVFSAPHRAQLRIRRLRSDAGLRLGVLAAGRRNAGRGGRWLPPVRGAVGRLLRGLTSVPVARLLGRPAYAVLGRREASSCDLENVNRILVVRLDRIGDLILTLPLIRELRRNAPRAELTLVVRPEVRELIAADPHVDRVLCFDPSAARRLPELVLHGRALRLAALHLWRRRPDLAIVPRLDTDIYHATFLAYFSAAPCRVAYSEGASAHKAVRNAGYDLLLTDPLKARGVKHEVERNLDVLRELGGIVREDRLELNLTAEARAFAAAKLSQHGVDPDQGTVVALGVGAGELKRRWPMPRYVELAEWLVSTADARLLVLGAPGEELLGKQLEAALGPRAINLVGRTTLAQAGAVLERADLFVGNDTGVMHLAAAVGTPVVVVSCHPVSAAPEHRNSPSRFGPWGVASRVLRPDSPLPPCDGACRGSDAHCIRQVEVVAARRAAAELLEEPAGEPSGAERSLQAGAER